MNIPAIVVGSPNQLEGLRYMGGGWFVDVGVGGLVLKDIHMLFRSGLVLQRRNTRRHRDHHDRKE